MADIKNQIGLKRSEVLKIEAEIVEIMENANFSVSNNVSLENGSEEGTFKMTFRKGEFVLGELAEVQKKLGSSITIVVKPYNKENVIVSLEAKEVEFSNFLKKRDDTLG